MSKLDEVLRHILTIPDGYTKRLQESYQSSCKAIDAEFQLLLRAREQRRRNTKLTTLQSINEDEVSATHTRNKQPDPVPSTSKTKDKHPEPVPSTYKTKEKHPEPVPSTSKEERPRRTSRTTKLASKDITNEEDKALPVRASRKRSKDEVDGLSSPEYDKRQKRNASVKAATVISKQAQEIQRMLDASVVLVNVNLNQKMRREEADVKPRESRSRRRKESNKENELPAIKIKQEKLSLALEPELMETDALPTDIVLKQEKELMPPPVAPMPKPRKNIPREKSEDSEEETTGRRRNTRKKAESVDNKTAEAMPPPPVPSTRSTRASSRSTKQDADDSAFIAPPEPRPKRTRAKKKKSEEASSTLDKEAAPQESVPPVSPTEKPRPKRTRRGKAAEQQNIECLPTKLDETPKIREVTAPVKTAKAQESTEKPMEDTKTDNPEEKKQAKSPILQKEIKKVTKSQIPRSNSKEKLKNLGHNSKEESEKEGKTEIKSQIPRQNTKERLKNQKQNSKEEKKKQEVESEKEEPKVNGFDETYTAKLANTTFTLDKTVIIPNGHCDHSPDKKNVNSEIVVLESHSRETSVLDKQHKIMDCTVTLTKDSGHMTEDDSLMTEDNSDVHTPPRNEAPKPAQPTSAVKEKVQQFEEMATRTTRTKTRAQAKKEEVVENHCTPPDNAKTQLSAETLNKMHNLIFNGKPPQQNSASATKPTTKNNVVVKFSTTASASKAYGIAKAKEAMEDGQKLKERDREDARKKKEALLEAKREEQKRKREEKMANAAAMREAAEKNRLAQLQQAAKERQEKQAHADQGKLERLKEVERKKQELARKVQETEERRRQEELARQQKLAEELRKAEIQRKKQQEELDAMKKEEARLQKETEKRQKEYKEKQKLKQKLEEKFLTPSKLIGTPQKEYKVDPVYMADGFEYLVSDEESDSPSKNPLPDWCRSEIRRKQLRTQIYVKQTHVDILFSSRVYNVDLREIFPNVDRRKLKRTSSAVWRTPPGNRLPTVNESPI